MPIEIEAKLKVDSFDDVIEKLNSIGAVYECTLHQGDYYFDDEKSSMVSSDSCLRIRSESVVEEHGRGEFEAILCFKGPKGDGKFKSRQEIETGVDDIKNTIAILGNLGYYKKLAFDKKRQLWKYGEAEICLDTLPLIGEYVEIEGPDENSVAEVQKLLNLEKIPHESRSYACLIDETLRETGSENREVFLK